VTVRVLICDDHPVYRRGLGVLLAEIDGIEVVGEAVDGEDALRQAALAAPDVVVMDLHLPGISGVDVTHELLARRPEMGVVVLTMFEDDTSLFAALRAGARGYLVKGADHEEIQRAILAVARGEALLGSAVSSRLARAVATPSRAHAFPELAPREFEILRLMTSGLSNQQIAARLFLSPKTVRNNVSSVLSKLHVSSRAEAAARARDAGVGVGVGVGGTEPVG
jgi:DNA-binding NarL/FixJ family response regulator